MPLPFMWIPGGSKCIWALALANLAIQDNSENYCVRIFLTQDKTNMLAEAHTLRALYYFILVRMYGAVPNVTQVPTDLNLKLTRVLPQKISMTALLFLICLFAEKSTLPWQDNTGGCQWVQ